MDIIEVILKHDIIYRPDTHTISKYNSKDSFTTLALPASLCFLCLLENKGDIVSHAKLYAFAWESRGINVSANTLYQNISILRKVLSNFGMPDNFIKTIPKRGFTITDTPEIQIIRESEEAKDNDETKGNDIPPADYEAQIREKNIHISFYAKMILIAALAFVLSFSMVHFFDKSRIPAYIPPEYIQLSKIDNCHVLRNKTLRADSFFYDFINKNNLKCVNPEWWYITNYPPSQKISLLRCNNKLLGNVGKEKTLCISHYYIGNTEAIDEH